MTTKNNSVQEAESSTGELKTVLSVFEKIKEKMPRYESRESQIHLGESIQYCFKSGKTGIFEAGTGIGKSLAALVPAALTDKRVVVSTATISLQEQYIKKDLPLIKEVVSNQLRIALMKGRGNYVGLRRFQDHMREEAVDQDIVDWIDSTMEGDISELEYVPHFETWQEINSSKDDCLRNRCPSFNDCFYFDARRRAETADILVVNHALLLADAVSMGKILPKYDLLIVDEAHHLRDIATEAFSSSISTGGIKRLVSRAQRKVSAPVTLIDHILRDSTDFFQHLNDQMQYKKLRLQKALDSAKPLLSSLEELKDWLDRQTFEDILDVDMARDKIKLKAKAIIGTIEGYQHCLSLISEPSLDWVVWAEKQDFAGQRIKVTAAPLDVSEQIHDFVLKKPGLESAIFMSATLATDTEDPFHYFKKNTGVSGKVVQDKFPSPFNFQEQSLLYLPKGMPDPNSPQYLPVIADRIEELLEITKGRAFVLFTSRYALNKVFEMVSDRLPFEAKRQGEMPRNKLVEWFKKTPNSVLFGTASFWEGVSVDGESLSCVIIDRIPFQVPDDPVYEARCERMQANQDENWFMDFALPHAITRLKQGVGRLIRTQEDMGMVSILDPRLTGKFYGKRMIRCLPPMKLVHGIDTVEDFFQAIDSDKSEQP